ncbi:hypothetical protein XENTR_v10023639 [Xenopus tropicalis]|nr:hypothetical protein XENTR_v10023639 [Xenopus tropicalis]
MGLPKLRAAALCHLPTHIPHPSILLLNPTPYTPRYSYSQLLPIPIYPSVFLLSARPAPVLATIAHSYIPPIPLYTPLYSALYSDRTPFPALTPPCPSAGPYPPGRTIIPPPLSSFIHHRTT